MKAIAKRKTNKPANRNELAERIAKLQSLRMQYAEPYCTALMGSGQSLIEVELADKLLTKARNRFIKAMESLAKLRKLNQPKRENGMDRSMRAVKLVKAIND